MQTSFIPKKPITESRIEDSGMSLFLLLAIIVFIVSVAMAGGIWLWRGALISQIAKDKQALVDARDSYQEDTINPLIRLNDRIEESKDLLASHLAISPVFIMLERNVLRNVRLKTMKFSFAGNDKIKIDLTGTAANYDALLKQSDAFGNGTLKDFITEPVVSDFNPTTDGSISFTFSASVEPRLISYDNILPETVTAPINTSDNTGTSSSPFLSE